MIVRSIYVVLLIISLSFYQHASAQESMFSIKPGNIIARIGFPARLDCQINTAGFVRWLVGATNKILPAPGCNCVVLSHNSSFSSLYFNLTTHATGGDYTCSIVGGPIGKINGSITIAVDPEITPNDFSITHNESDTFAINVSVTGVPHPTVTWLKDGVNFTSELTGVTASRSGLQVTNASHRAAGRYRIRASNEANTDINFYNIFINFLPIITMTRDPDISEVPVGSSVTVTCSIMSYPGSSVHWEQQTDNKYTTLSAFNERNDSSSMFMVVTNSTIMFAGEDINGASKYCCAATNIIGVAKKCLDFTELGAPPRPSGFNVTERTPSSITVQWDPPSLDGVTHELSYHIDNSNNESWDRETVESGATSYRLENLRSNTSYVLRLTALRNSIRSLPTSQLIVRTRISVPRGVRSFKVDSTANPGTFELTWQAPLESVVDYYNVYVRGPNDYNDMIKVDGMKLGLNISDLSENVEYMFAIQAVNDGGDGNVTSYRSGIFCLTIPMITAQYLPHGTTVNISWHLSDSMYSMRNIMLVIVEQSRTTFVSEPIDAGNRQHCVSNLRPNTRYEIRVIAILGCDNISSELDVLTQSPDTPATIFPSQNCIVFNSTTLEDIDEESASDTLEVWVIVLIVILPLLAVVVMMSIGIYCACKKRYISTKDPELPPVTHTSSQAPFSHHTRNPSASSYTGSLTSGATTPIRSPSSYHSRSVGYRPALYNGRIDEQPSLGQQY